jgi:hypothetical protein
MMLQAPEAVLHFDRAVIDGYLMRARSTFIIAVGVPWIVLKGKFLSDDCA